MIPIRKTMDYAHEKQEEINEHCAVHSAHVPKCKAETDVL